MFYRILVCKHYKPLWLLCLACHVEITRDAYEMTERAKVLN